VASPGLITRLLLRWREGDQSALDQLMPLVYPRLKAIASSFEGSRSAADGIQATALVNEAFLRLVKSEGVSWESREHFFSLAALAMRHILTDYARAYLTTKRGGALKRVPLHEHVQWVSVNSEEMLDLNQALDELAKIDPRKVRMVELRYILGCTAEETAELLGVSRATVDREIDVARAWLFRRLRGAGSQPNVT
jgi:RNA polymerase sigma factor (TIGR02999 family)